MIESFKCTYTKDFWKTGKSRQFPPSILKAALRKLVILDAATELKDLKAPPGNKVETLKGNREGQYSLHI